MFTVPEGWHTHEIGRGRVMTMADGLHLTVPEGAGPGYHNAQIDDYSGGPGFMRKPPLRLTVTAWTDGPLDQRVGTAGFGFWNHPFGPGGRGLRLPAAVWWFFAALPNDLRLALDVPGHGWKAAALDAARPRAWSMLPLAPAAAVAFQSARLYRRWYPALQRRLGIAERALDAALLLERHTYTLEWRADGARFAIDGEPVLETDSAPRGPLGAVIWIDNQYAVATPQGRIRFGTRPVTAGQTLILEDLRIE